MQEIGSINDVDMAHGEVSGEHRVLYAADNKNYHNLPPVNPTPVSYMNWPNSARPMFAPVTYCFAPKIAIGLRQFSDSPVPVALDPRPETRQCRSRWRGGNLPQAPQTVVLPGTWTGDIGPNSVYARNIDTESQMQHQVADRGLQPCEPALTNRTA